MAESSKDLNLVSSSARRFRLAVVTLGFPAARFLSALVEGPGPALAFFTETTVDIDEAALRDVAEVEPKIWRLFKPQTGFGVIRRQHCHHWGHRTRRSQRRAHERPRCSGAASLEQFGRRRNRWDTSRRFVLQDIYMESPHLVLPLWHY